jgi:hypothetical protein
VELTVSKTKEDNTMTRTNSGMIQDVIGLARAASREDRQAFVALMPTKLEDAQIMLEVATRILYSITEGPQQDALFDQIVKQAQVAGGNVPDPEQRTGG